MIPAVAHVRPIGDLIQHEFAGCICGPTLEIISRRGGPAHHEYTHHALDGRPTPVSTDQP